MPRRDDSILELLMLLPWWVSAISSIAVYILLGLVAPAIVTGNPIVNVFLQAFSRVAWVFSLALLFPAVISFFNQKRKHQILEEQKSLESIRKLGWKEFEELVGEAYRRQGYKVIENEGKGPDGGIDLRLVKDGSTHLVQCKQWRSMKVGVRIVREMFGVLIAEKAASVIIVTSGAFTQEAKNFARGRAIDLVEGKVLESLVRNFKSKERPVLPKPPQSTVLYSNPPSSETLVNLVCPRCGSKLVRRTAKRGASNGKQFYGCSSFPNCRYIQSMTARASH